jgi:leucine-rich repeat protein SHOC2
MEQAELTRIIEQARRDRLTELDLQNHGLTILPDSIGNLTDLTSLNLYGNSLTSLPESIGKLSKLVELSLGTNQLTSLPTSVIKLTRLVSLALSRNQFTTLPDQIVHLSNLTGLYLNDNQLISLPANIGYLTKLTELYLNDNPWIDLSNLHDIPNLKRAYCFGVNLSRQHWTHRCNWKPEWLLNEINSQIRHALIEQLTCDVIFEELASFTPDRMLPDGTDSKQTFKLDLSGKQLKALPEKLGHINYLTELNLGNNQLVNLPKNIGNLSNLTWLNLEDNQLTSLPKSIGNLSSLTWLNLEDNQLVNLPVNIVSLSNLNVLNIGNNQLTSLPQRIDKLDRLTELDLSGNQLSKLPESIGNLPRIAKLCLANNQLVELPENIGNLSTLDILDLQNNQLTSLPKSIKHLSNLDRLYLDNNPWLDLSSLQTIPNFINVSCFNIRKLPRKYWSKLSEWKPKWLLDEDNAEIRRVLIDRIGYEKICDELNAITIDTWREYTLLKIDGLEKVYDGGFDPIDTEPMVLLKMTCPSTAHTHILRVPPEMVSAEAAITWVNHGIHPDRFVIQT